MFRRSQVLASSVAIALSAALAGSPGPSIAANSGPNVAAARSGLDQACTELQSAVNQGNAGAIVAARGKLQALLAAEPRSALLHYWVAVADWRAAPLLDSKRKDDALRYCKDGVQHCDQALEIDSKFGEALAVKAGLQGMSIHLEPGSMMTLGMQSEMNLGKARKLSPENPRVWLMDGVNTLHKPSFVGGGAKPALEKLKKAQELFVGAPGAAGGPAWGQDDAWLWAGRCAMELEDYDSAQAFYRKALELNPQNGWVRTQLLPAAERATAKAKS